jgi:hypothetical protein
LSHTQSPDEGHRRAVLDGQRRFQRSRLVSGLNKILVATMICGGLLAAVASGGAFSASKSGVRSAGGAGAAINAALFDVAVGIVLALWVVFRYWRNFKKAKRDYVTRGNGADRAASGAGDPIGRLPGGHGLVPGQPVPDEQAPSTVPDYTALAEVEYGGQKGMFPDGVNRSDNPSLGPIE